MAFFSLNWWIGCFYRDRQNWLLPTSEISKLPEKIQDFFRRSIGLKSKPSIDLYLQECFSLLFQFWFHERNCRYFGCWLLGNMSKLLNNPKEISGKFEFYIRWWLMTNFIDTISDTHCIFKNNSLYAF